MEISREHRKHIGLLGESIACRFLEQKDFVVRERNYRENWGEIDIIVEKKKAIYFIEVKTVIDKKYSENSRNLGEGDFLPEENIHPQKIKRINRAANSYLNKMYKERAHKIEWQIDAVIVLLDTKSKKASIRYIEGIGY